MADRDPIVGIPVFLVWDIAKSLLVRPFDIRLPLLPLPVKKYRAAISTLSKKQYIFIEGALGWGVSTWLLITATNLASSKIGLENYSSESISSFIGGLLIFMLGGVGWGWVMSGMRSKPTHKI